MQFGLGHLVYVERVPMSQGESCARSLAADWPLTPPPIRLGPVRSSRPAWALLWGPFHREVRPVRSCAKNRVFGPDAARPAIHACATRTVANPIADPIHPLFPLTRLGAHFISRTPVNLAQAHEGSSAKDPRHRSAVCAERAKWMTARRPKSEAKVAQNAGR